MVLLPLALLALNGLAEESPTPSASNCTWQPDTDYAPTSSSGTFTAATKEECCEICWAHSTPPHDCRYGVDDI